MNKPAWLESFSAYLTLFTNHPILWTVIVILLLSLVVLNYLIERRERRALAKKNKENEHSLALKNWKEKMSTNHHLEEEDMQSTPSSRWTIQTEVNDTKDSSNNH